MKQSETVRVGVTTETNVCGVIPRYIQLSTYIVTSLRPGNVLKSTPITLYCKEKYVSIKNILAKRFTRL